MKYRFVPGYELQLHNSEVLRYRCLQGSADLQNSFGTMHAASNRTNRNPVLALSSGRKSHVLLHVTADRKDIFLGF